MVGEDGYETLGEGPLGASGVGSRFEISICLSVETALNCAGVEGTGAGIGEGFRSSICVGFGATIQSISLSSSRKELELGADQQESDTHRIVFVATGRTLVRLMISDLFGSLRATPFHVY